MLAQEEATAVSHLNAGVETITLLFLSSRFSGVLTIVSVSLFTPMYSLGPENLNSGYELATKSFPFVLEPPTTLNSPFSMFQSSILKIALAPLPFFL